MDKKMMNIRVFDLLEQIQKVDKMIVLHSQSSDPTISKSVVLQYVALKQDFIDQLNDIFKAYSISVAAVNPPIAEPKSYKKYDVEALALSEVHEEQITIKKSKPKH